MIRFVNTHTGKIYFDEDKKLEFLSVGDYGKENNIKANFLGLTKEINGVKNTQVNLHDKWVATISTQKGCPMKCTFCDVHKYGYYGNATTNELEWQVKSIIADNFEACSYTNRFNVHFARMGEPTFNTDVLDFAENRLKKCIKESGLNANVIHPVLSTMLPKNLKNACGFGLQTYLELWCKIKNESYNGEAGLQFSINSTNDEQRNKQFASLSCSLTEISRIAEILPTPIGRKYTLNFAITENTILDVNTLNSLFDKNKFIVKITPIHNTLSARENKYIIGDTYENYNVYKKFEQPLLNSGWDVIVFVPSYEEDSDRITCGNALLFKKTE